MMDAQTKAMHRHYMKVCLSLAREGSKGGYLGIASVIVRAGDMIAQAHETMPHAWDVTGHAELLAIRQACRRMQSSRLLGCTIYTTAEPCWMCAYAIRETGIETVVIGAPTRDVGALSSKYPLLSDNDIACWGPAPHIINGVMAEACADLRDGDQLQ